MFKLIELLNSEKRKVLAKFCKYINLAFKHKKSLIKVYIYIGYLLSVYSVTLCLYIVYLLSVYIA